MRPQKSIPSIYLFLFLNDITSANKKTLLQPLQPDENWIPWFFTDLKVEFTIFLTFPWPWKKNPFSLTFPLVLEFIYLFMNVNVKVYIQNPFQGKAFTSMLCTYQFKAGGGGGGGGGGGRAWGGDLTFFKNLPSNSLPTGKPFQSNAQKFPHPGRHIAVKYRQAGCKKDARKTGRNRTL